jgi:hypothetical protein
MSSTKNSTTYLSIATIAVSIGIALGWISKTIFDTRSSALRERERNKIHQLELEQKDKEYKEKCVALQKEHQVTKQLLHEAKLDALARPKNKRTNISRLTFSPSSDEENIQSSDSEEEDNDVIDSNEKKCFVTPQRKRSPENFNLKQYT